MSRSRHSLRGGEGAERRRRDCRYYHVKDIAFLRHEPIINKFREFKGYMKKVRKASGRGDIEEAKRLNEVRGSQFFFCFVSVEIN